MVLPLSLDELTTENSAYFSGIVHRAEVATSPDNSFKVFQVNFAASARTHWHTHTDKQRLIVLQGSCIIQREGHKAIVLHEGQAISLPANERHWHGATPKGPMCHLAINDDLKTEWLEPLSDSLFQAAILEASD